MIIPGVQKPHWRPCWSQNACWSGWSLPPCSMPSIVRDLGAVGLDGEHRARLGAAPVDVDGARAAVAGVAAGVGAGEPERVAQEVDEEEARLDVGLARLAVDGDRDVLCRHRHAPMRERDGRARRPVRSDADGQLGDHRALVVGRTPDVRGGFAGRGRRGAGGAERVLARLLPDEQRPRRRGRERRRRDPGHADARALDRPVASRSRSRATPAVAKSPTRRSSFV